jgi:aspartyl-tRNA(Asn)/glutamyl-tRNA(Gln) amidotransferase subunit C
MKVTEKEVAYVADLAHLDLTEAERTRMVKDLNSILEHIDELNELDTANVPPMAQVAVGQGDAQRPFGHARRADEVRPSLPHKEAMQNAPEHNPDFFKVPKVIER